MVPCVNDYIAPDMNARKTIATPLALVGVVLAAIVAPSTGFSQHILSTVNFTLPYVR